MASKVFLDANILLDLTLKRDHFDISKQIIELAINGKIQAFTSPSVINVCAHWLTKVYNDTKAKELLITLLADVKVIDIEHDIVLNALLSRINDIEDAIQYYAALHHRMDYFITRDKQLQKQAISVLPIYSPDDFLKEFENA